MANDVSGGAGVGAGAKYLSFRLAGEEYGIDILRVREIIGMVELTALPRTPEHVLGVVNLRGRITPVIDLRRKLGIAAADSADDTCIVVVDAGPEAGSAAASAAPVGCLVDSVREVVTIGADNHEPAPGCANGGGHYIRGLARQADRVLILLDIELVLSEVDAAALGAGRRS